LQLTGQRLLKTLEDAPKNLNALANDPREQRRIAHWERDVVSRVRVALTALGKASADKGWLAHYRLKRELGFFLRFPSVYSNDYFAQWSTKGAEIDALFDKTFELARTLSGS